MEKFKCYTSTSEKTKEILELFASKYYLDMNNMDFSKPFLLYDGEKFKQVPLTAYGLHEFRHFDAEEISIDELFK